MTDTTDAQTKAAAAAHDARADLVGLLDRHGGMSAYLTQLIDAMYTKAKAEGVCAAAVDVEALRITNRLYNVKINAALDALRWIRDLATQIDGSGQRDAFPHPRLQEIVKATDRVLIPRTIHATDVPDTERRYTSGDSTVVTYASESKPDLSPASFDVPRTGYRVTRASDGLCHQQIKTRANEGYDVQCGLAVDSSIHNSGAVQAHAFRGRVLTREPISVAGTIHEDPLVERTEVDDAD